MKQLIVVIGSLLLGVFILPDMAFAESFGVNVDFGNQQDMTTSVKTFILVGILGLAPFFLMALTPYPYIATILGLVKQGLGANTVPPPQVLTSMALFMTLFVMGPVVSDVYSNAYKPYSENKITFEQSIKEAEKPIRKYMLKHTEEKDILTLLKVKKEEKPKKPEDLSFWTLVPAYVLSMINGALLKGAFLMLAFVVIDIVVGAVLMFLGMMMLPPNIVSTPIKIILFIGAGGFTTLMELVLKTLH
ncbi:flagellar biosynthesis protein flip [Bacillus bombysepticus]|uniref:flagellar biosynthesis protein flip n=1 Tax=Bacillus bombysepticus TaxID=658666 RepID=UPI003019D170